MSRKRCLLLSFTFGSLMSFISSFDIKNRIVGGYDTQISDHPYMVDYSDGCGGSIISDRWILTAAHCSQGSWVKVGSTVKGNGKLYLIEKSVIHPQFGASDTILYDFDYQLLKLYKPLTFSDTVQPIELGSKSDIVPGAMATVTGWGATEENGEYPNILQSVEVPIIGDCKELVVSEDTSYQVTDRMICAGFQEGMKDACQGDSGGPLTINDKLIGVVSFGFGCARPNLPGIYSKVSEAKSWICETANVC